ncbi:unnamed protein product [Allacma fusca]|uniref:Ricin B lectin domain-containing protein n=1 Tax=Allacma fusca TaxID=39272 RepID=A0A8J2PF21_9HEXA|nr:unnamed protein product [Allacma fusca]
MKLSYFSFLLVFFLNWKLSAAITTGDIYTLDSLVDDSVSISLVARSDGSVTVEPFSNNAPEQRFIVKTVSGGTNIFNLFTEAQPWNWIDYIVESSKTVNIKETPQILDVAIKDGVQTVFLGDYKGQNMNSHKWYVVPSGGDELVGRLTNVANRLCLINNGPNASATVGICNPSDPNQLWRLTRRTQGRCY